MGGSSATRIGSICANGCARRSDSGERCSVGCLPSRMPPERGRRRRSPNGALAPNPNKVARFLPEPDFDHDRQTRLGVLLVNLGTPDAPTAAAVRRFLAEFLTDRRV